MGIGLSTNYFQNTTKPHVVTDIELDEMVNAIHDLEDFDSNKFDPSGGHKHTGSGTDAPNIPWSGIDTAVKSSSAPPAIMSTTTGAVGTATKFSREDHNHAHADHNGATGVHAFKDLHHDQVHGIDGSDHTGTLAVSKITAGTNEYIIKVSAGTAIWSNTVSALTITTLTFNNHTISSEKTFYISMGGGVLLPVNSTQSITRPGEPFNLLNGEASSQGFTMAVIVPDGVELDEIRVRASGSGFIVFADHNMNTDVNNSLTQENFSSGVATYSSMGVTIDNENYSYALNVSISAGGSIKDIRLKCKTTKIPHLG
jgi:hypothetical protein